MQTRDWAVADAMLRTCPKDWLPDVGFLLLQHVVLDGYAKKEDLH